MKVKWLHILSILAACLMLSASGCDKGNDPANNEEGQKEEHRVGTTEVT